PVLVRRLRPGSAAALDRALREHDARSPGARPRRAPARYGRRARASPVAPAPQSRLRASAAGGGRDRGRRMTPTASPEVVVLEDASAVAAAGGTPIAPPAAQASPARPPLPPALSGGETPRATYAALGRHEDVNWTAVDLFFGDERAVPPDHPQSNYAMVQSSLLAYPGPARARVYRMPADAADLDEAALEYE